MAQPEKEEKISLNSNNSVSRSQNWKEIQK